MARSRLRHAEQHGTSGALVGLSCHAGYINQDGEMLSLAMPDAAHAVPGTQVAVTWGEPNGGSRRPQAERHEQTAVRATVAQAPFNPAVRDRFREPVGAR